uniref:ATP synthase subunit a n=1 Tax=Megacopta cribraria TaxID=299257 RepID=W8VK01_MEGCI|nr:ATP synthase F0 subunit 6 [Megacopta cribraria]UYA97503.1 ATP synthase F0 subunit 6 [Megacopta cribraria]UYA97516.1 ATP synthase F0 subunit 6 [Megacopta cribraria]BAO52068.1 ATP synthase F0 subunit 6 [Megacopta cribraria]BAO52077.1 ATP synthase F0 subunit 6 [Megacopta cribraria]
MMTNLFSTFDPATSMNVSMNWMSSLTSLLLIPLTFWALPNRISFIGSTVNKTLHEEFKMLMGPSSTGMTLVMITMFNYIFINNIMGLLPYIFTSSSHLAFSMTLALPLWLSTMLYGWTNKTNSMFSHLVPSGTPAALMPFMVIIETVSNLIRPGSLAVRLTANMIAGHLLMSLLGNNTISVSNIILPLIMIIQMVLMMFETAVAIIQAYVFSVLSTLYTSEVI